MTPIGNDFVSDVAGAAGILLQIPWMDGAESGVKLIAGIAGLVLLYWSIRHKILLVQEAERARREKNKKPDGEGQRDADID